MPYTGGFPELGNEGRGDGGLQVVRGRYDFAVDGGAVADIDLIRDALPAGAIVLGGFVEVVTPPTSGGAASLGLKLEGTGDLVATAVVSGAPWSTAGRKSIVPVFTGATSVKTTTATRKIQAQVTVAALTAGVFDVVLFYVKLY